MKNYCHTIYGDDSPWNNVAPTIIDMPAGMAAEIRDEVESGIERGELEWTKRRHKNYPTRDISVTEEALPTTSKHAIDLLKSHIGPVFETKYEGVSAEELTFQEAFVVRYGSERGGQNKLKKHVDGSPLSFVCALNDDFEGGGTRIGTETCTPKKGQCCLFAGGVQKHEGLPITSGERLILTGFVNHGPTLAECERLVRL